MATSTFPVVIWPLTDKQLLGQIVGTTYSVVDSSESGIVRSAKEYLTKTIALEGDIEAPDMDNPVLKFYEVTVQMVYRQRAGVYPLPGRNSFTVAAVHNHIKKTGFGQCYLPLYNESFYYHDQEQLKSLIDHFVRDFLENLAPEEALQYRMPRLPVLAKAEIQVRTRRRRSIVDGYDIPSSLREVCDRLPLPPKERKALSRVPEVGWEREKFASTFADALITGNDNIILVGEQGVGKTTILNDAIKIAARETKKQTQPITVWRTTSQRLISKAKYLGEWQQICDQVVEDLQRVNGVLWITDLANLMHIGGESQEDSVAAYLQTYIVKGQLRIIGEMHPRQIDSATGLLPGFVQCFELTTVLELESDACLRVLQFYANYVETNFRINVETDALELAMQLVERYIKYERAPGKHVRFFSECIKFTEDGNQTISRDSIISIFSTYTGLPEVLLRDELALKQDALFSHFSAQIIGQDHVLMNLCRVVQTFKAGLNDPDKPIATLLFAGPTGVGKTAAAKALSAYFFETGLKRNPLFRLDMSEFQYAGHVERLIGDPATPSKLVQHVRKNPFSVILLDEIEKAHETIFDALLTVLDEGILTDRFGRTTDFRSSIIIMTTNLGVDGSHPVGFSDSGTNDVSINAIRKFFRPEFFNRIDDVLAFKALSKRAVHAITRIELNNIRQRDRIGEAGLQLEFSDALVEFIANAGFSSVYGARPIQRAVEKHVVRAISNTLLSSPLSSASSSAAVAKLVVDVHENQVQVSVSS